MRRRFCYLILAIWCIVPVACDTENATPEDGDISVKPVGEKKQVDRWHRDISLKQARAAALKEDKLLFVAANSQSCGACRAVDNLVLSSDEVREFLREQTVSIKVEVKEERAFAMKYGIMGTPTLLFLKPDGKEIDRFMGMVSKTEFLTYARAFVDGFDSVALARYEVILARHKLGSCFARKGELREARNEYVKALDMCMDNIVLFKETGFSLVGDLFRIGKAYPGAKKSLRKRNNEARKRLRAGEAKPADMLLVIGINRYLNQPDETLALFDEVFDKYNDADFIPVWTRASIDLFTAVKRYKDIEARLDIEKSVDRLFDEAKKHRPSEQDYDTKGDYLQAKKAYETSLRYNVYLYYEVLIGLERHSLAKRTADRLLKEVPSAMTLNGLAWAGYLTGRPTEENLRQAREAYGAVSGRQIVAVVDTLARVLALRGKVEEAVDILNREIANAPTKEFKKPLKQCLAEIRADAKGKQVE